MDQTSSLSATTDALLQQLAAQPARVTAGPYVHASDTAGSIYFLYETLRNAAEYREQHLFLRSAIERYIHRQLKLFRPDEQVGHELVEELIKTRYVPNDRIPVAVADEISRLLRNYIELVRGQDKLFGNMAEIASAHIAQLVLPQPKDEAIVNFTYQSFKQHIDAGRASAADEHSFGLALYLAVHRALLKSDMATVRYYLFVASFPRWEEFELDQVHVAAGRFAQFNDGVDAASRGRLAQTVYKLVRRHIAPYLVLRQIVLESPNPPELFTQPSLLAGRVTQVCNEQYHAAHEMLRRSIGRAIIFLFLTKTLLAVALELPFDLWTIGHIGARALAINLLVPPAYMFAIGLGIKVPGEANTRKIHEDIMAIVYSKPTGPHYAIPGQARTSGLLAAFNVLYAATFALSMAGLVWLLFWLHFNLVSGIVFFIFLCTVSFFGYRISQAAKQLVVVEQRQGFLGNLLDFFSTPFIKVGQWLSDTYRQINVATFVLDFLIEMPLKTLLKVFEQWKAFLREKREDVL
jgi:hypothetical protein